MTGVDHFDVKMFILNVSVESFTLSMSNFLDSTMYLWENYDLILPFNINALFYNVLLILRLKKYLHFFFFERKVSSFLCANNYKFGLKIGNGWIWFRKVLC